MKTTRVLAAACCLAVGVLDAGAASAATGDSASGQGTLNGGARHFSFNARRAADGTVTGQAQLVNRDFAGTADNPAPYRAHIEISCMNRYPDGTVVFGGTVTRTNDPNLDGAVYFSVKDNGEPGTTDQISRAFFFDDTPGNTGDPQACLLTEATAFPLETIESGNIRVSPAG